MVRQTAERLYSVHDLFQFCPFVVASAPFLLGEMTSYTHYTKWRLTNFFEPLEEKFDRIYCVKDLKPPSFFLLNACNLSMIYPNFAHFCSFPPLSCWAELLHTSY